MLIKQLLMNQATADLMSFFYTALAEGLSNNEALYLAKLQYLAQSNELFAHPFYWAGFVAQGNPKPLHLKGSFPTQWLIGGFISLLAIFGGFLFFRNKHHKSS